MNFYTADLHFGHRKILEYDHRPFSSVEEMDKTLIENWNRKVRDNDDVYILGDISLQNAAYYLKQLKGRKHLIVGNHDKQTLKDKEARSCFETIDYYKKIHENGHTIILFHYPIAEWDGFYRDSILIYGHIHSSITEAYRFMEKMDNAFNAGCMINNYEPVTLDELMKNNIAFKKADSE